MDVPTYDELLDKKGVTSSTMEQTFDDDDLQKFSLVLEKWEKLARSLRLPNPEIDNIKGQGDIDEQKIKMLVCWKQRRGSMATYTEMVETLLQIGRTDLAEKVIALRCQGSENTRAHHQKEPSPLEPSKAASPSPGSSNGIGNMSPRTPTLNTAQQEVVISHLRELEEEFYELVTFIEASLRQKDDEECLVKILRRFSMLPQSIRRQYQTDENYTATRQRILSSTTTKDLFDNLTALKHWSYMMPDTLAHIVQDVKIDDIQQKIDKYKKKLVAFKSKTELKDIVTLCFPVPDYCIELTVEVKGWEYKTIAEAENATLNILRKAAYSGGIGLKAVTPGSLYVTFIFLEPTMGLKIDQFIEACKNSGVIRIQIEEEEVYGNDHPTYMCVRDDDDGAPNRDSNKEVY